MVAWRVPMSFRTISSDHSFHVPVMGIGFTIDSPIRLAPLGIDSAISLVSDSVVEAARRHHSKQRLLPYKPIDEGQEQARSRRFTEYLNLVNRLVKHDLQRISSSSFDDPSGIRRYFELLPSDSAKRLRFLEVDALPPGDERENARNELRHLVHSGSIGVNIMTKLDSNKDAKGEIREPHDSDAHAALRGFAQSTVEGPLILSAGANPGLFAYLAEFDDFFPNEDGHTRKTIVLKVSDFRSAHVQGRMLARRGLWVSEYRIESGLNCGGHAFPTEGLLLGPILEEFKQRRGELEELATAYKKGLEKRAGFVPEAAPQLRITAQGGIGTAREDALLRTYFGLDGTGWGSPFLMVPEAVSLDPDTKLKLENATIEDIKLTWSSPLGVRFWWLSTCGSEEKRMDRIGAGLAGSVCTGRHLALNEDYGKVPLCTGSRAYQRKRLAELDPADPEYGLKLERLQAPACICVDLCGSFLSWTKDDEAPPPAICPGPNIVNFQKTRSLEEMVDHIYGRKDILTRTGRPHMFIREAELYLDVFQGDLELLNTSLAAKTTDQLEASLATLAAGIEYYRSLLQELCDDEQASFSVGLGLLSERLAKLQLLRTNNAKVCA
jgi:hypothetical protein